MRTTATAFFVLLLTVFLHGASETPVKERKMTMMSPEQMMSEVQEKAARVAEIEAAMKKIQAEAENEKDIKWKMCLSDILATIRGLAASIQTARARMLDLVRAEKGEAAQTQMMLVRGLADAAEKAFVDAQACPRQLTRVDNRSTVEKEQKKDVTGTHGEKDTIGDAMGQDFSTDWASERDPNDLGSEDMIDGAGTDNTGGPAETPGTTGGESDSVADHGDSVSVPPFVEASPEK